MLRLIPLIAIVLLGTACSHRKCIGYDYRSVPVSYCAYFAAGYCQRTETKYEMRQVCAVSVCEDGYYEDEHGNCRLPREDKREPEVASSESAPHVSTTSEPARPALSRPLPLVLDASGLPAWKGAKTYATRVREAVRVDADAFVDASAKAAKWRKLARVAKMAGPAGERAREWEEYAGAVAAVPSKAE